MYSASRTVLIAFICNVLLSVCVWLGILTVCALLKTNSIFNWYWLLISWHFLSSKRKVYFNVDKEASASGDEVRSPWTPLGDFCSQTPCYAPNRGDRSTHAYGANKSQNVRYSYNNYNYYHNHRTFNRTQVGKFFLTSQLKYPTTAIIKMHLYDVDCSMKMHSIN